MQIKHLTLSHSAKGKKTRKREEKPNAKKKTKKKSPREYGCQWFSDVCIRHLLFL